MKIPLALFLLLLLLSMIGCGDVKVEGKVTFSDGTPLSTGKIIFEDATHTFTAKIREDGTFRLGKLKDGEGIPAGRYKVGVGEAFTEKFPAADKPPVVKHLIVSKFRSPQTSGIEYDIQKKTTDISIIVEKP
ncbi:MAG: hypothetical protein LBT05_06030 [Planctomycetaceae bacterium]|jgi:hypothetical protein|nr:hypothetical protein [Planctomycetaceae bacterium]